MPRDRPELLYTAEQVRELDRRAIEDHGIDGYALMERAGAAAFRLLRLRWPDARRIGVYCGGGNNGGDGLVVARLAHQAGFDVEVGLNRDPSQLKGAAANAWSDWAASGGNAHGFDELSLDSADVIVDGLLGTGLDRPVAGAVADAIASIRAAGRPVLALDIPSGIEADSGAVLGDAVAASVTVTFIGAKRGLFTGAAPDYTGRVVLESLAVPPAVYQDMGRAVASLDAPDAIEAPPRRRPTAHKGDAGHVLIVGGERGFAGAPRMAGEAALRCGTGLISVATRASHAGAIAAARPELMVHPVEEPAADLGALLERADVVAIGPGLGRGEWADAALQTVADCARGVCVADADALNGLAARRSAALPASVITPHPGEAARLLEQSTASVQQDRFAAVRRLSREADAIAVLKGAGTIVAAPSGEASLLPGARPQMASGGMGDVLTGVIASLLAQGMDSFAAAQTGVWLHARAADRTIAEWGVYGLVASDLLAALARLRGEAADG